MSKLFPLQVLLDLAHEKRDEAASQLGVINGHDRAMQERLRLLLEYRDEYAARFTADAQLGMDSTGWKNFHEFIDAIDAAIDQQREIVADARRKVAAGQLQWQAQQRKLKSFDTLSQRHYSLEQSNEARLEQKEQDDSVLKAFISQRMMNSKS
ncbi:MAG: flagellar export protein FliJ [Comamonadaceae bacterium]|jgi:flagellar protein FliJ